MDFKRKTKQFSVFVLTALVFVVCLTGCRNSKKELAEKFSAYLKRTYQKEFVVESVTINNDSSTRAYEAICYPADDPGTRFEVSCNERGIISWDLYPGAIMAREEEKFFSESIGEGLGESIVKCKPFYLNDTWTDYPKLWDCIRAGTFDVKTAYSFYPVVDYMTFTIYLNADTCEEDYGKEYDSIGNAVNDMVEKYHDLYGVDLEVCIDIYNLDGVTYQSVKDYYENPSKELELYYILIDARWFEMKMRDDGEGTCGLDYTRDQYIAKREGKIVY